MWKKVAETKYTLTLYQFIWNLKVTEELLHDKIPKRFLCLIYQPKIPKCLTDLTYMDYGWDDIICFPT